MASDLDERQEERGSSGEPAEPATDAEGVVVHLWARRPVSGARTAVIDRLGALRTADAVADFEVRTWPDTVVLSEHTEHTRVVEAYWTFREWAGNNGVSISPPFDRRTATSLVGRTREVLTLPTLCLAVYDGDTLRGVFPCQQGDRTHTVSEFLDVYEDVGGDPDRAVVTLLSGDS